MREKKFLLTATVLLALSCNPYMSSLENRIAVEETQQDSDFSVNIKIKPRSPGEYSPVSMIIDNEGRNNINGSEDRLYARMKELMKLYLAEHPEFINGNYIFEIEMRKKGVIASYTDKID